MRAATSCGLPADAAPRWIAFDSTSSAYNRDIFLVRADGTVLTQFTTDPSTEKDPAFSNDGSHLAFVSDRSGTMQIYVMDLGTRAVKPLTSLAAGADEPSWSRDDTQIAFHSGASVYVMGADGSNPRIVGTGLDDFNTYEYPAFSVDGTQLVFDRRNEIDVLHLDGTGFRYVVQNTTTIMETPAVSPDGVNIAFAVEQSNERIAYTPLAGTADAFSVPTVTPASYPPARRPAWGPDGVIAFEYALTMFNDNISSAGIALSTGPGTTPCEIIAGPGDSRNPSWAPAGFQPGTAGQ